MKADIHPKYHSDCKVTCACGNTFVTGSTVPSLHIEICGNCHPFYTGKQKLVDTAKRVDKFMQKMEKKAKISSTAKPKKARKSTKAEKTTKPEAPAA